MIPYRIRFEAEVQRQIYSLPHHIYMRVRSELSQLAESAAVSPPVGPRWLDSNATHLPSDLCIEGWRVLFELDADAREVHVVGLKRLDAGGTSVA